MENVSTIYLSIGLLVAMASVVIGWRFYTRQIAFWFAPLLFILVWVFWPFILVALVILLVRK